MKNHVKKIILISLLLFMAHQGVFSQSLTRVDLNLYIAAGKGNIEKVREELAKGPTRKGIDYALRHMLIVRYRGTKDTMIEIMDLLIEKGANINQKNTSGRPMLMSVARHGSPFILEYLLKNGGKVNITSGRCSTLIRKASFWGRLKNVRVLLRYGTKVNPKNGCSSPLHSAAIGGNRALNVTRFLLEKGAKINALDPQGRTPLVMACLNGRKNSAKFLLEKGADPNIPTKKGYTALSAAKTLHRIYSKRKNSYKTSLYRNIIQELEKRGAKEGQPYRISGGR